MSLDIDIDIDKEKMIIMGVAFENWSVLRVFGML